MKKIAFALIVALFLLPLMACAAEYEATLPDGYEQSGLRYPVLYLLPRDGLNADDSGLAEKLGEAMRNGGGLPMIIVRPAFAADADVSAALKETVDAVDAAYRTIPDPAHRAAVGTGAGGYLAYILTLEDGSPFGAAASIRGNFAGNENPWIAKLGSVQERMKELSAADKNAFNAWYTYMDAPVNDEWTDMPGSTDDLGALMIEAGTGSAYHEFTVRPGAFDDAFLSESAARLMDRLTRRMLDGVISGALSLQKASLTAEDASVSADYTLTVTDALLTFAPEGTDIEVRLEAAGQLGAETVKAMKAGEATGVLTVDNAVEDKAEAVLSASLLGVKIDLASASVVRVQEVEGAVDLSGDWHFNYVGAQQMLDAAALTPADFAEWPIVQPGLGNWTKGYGNISDENVTSGYGPDYFDFFIVGNGYYARTFAVPSDFDASQAVLSIGNVDDRCEVFLNGARVGATGMDEKGMPTGETTWAEYSAFAVDPALLRVGDENTVIVRAWNDLPFGAGGWYSGPIGLYEKETFDALYGADANARFYEETFESAFAAHAQGQEQEGTVENQYLIYLPPDYNETDRDYPTVYLLHQFNSDHTSYRTDKINELLDAGITAGKFDPMIVVIPNSSEESWWRGDWEKMITEELIPVIDTRYRTIQDARYRLTAGCSMGGQGAYGVALRNPDYFSGAVSFFGAFSYGGEANPVLIAGNESAEYMNYFALYFICGNQDNYGFGAPAIRLHQQLSKLGTAHRFFIENGAHDSAFYLPFFEDAFSYIRARMYHSGEEAERMLSGSMTLNGTALHAELTADSAISDLMLTVPASAYTREEHPELSVSLMIEIKQNGVTARTYAERGARLSPERLTAAYDLDIGDRLDPSAAAQITLKAAIFDRVVTLQTLMLKPNK